MGLRLAEGVDLDRIANLSGIDAGDLVSRKAIERLERQSLVKMEAARLRVTESGMLLLDAILADIVAA